VHPKVERETLPKLIQDNDIVSRFIRQKEYTCDQRDAHHLLKEALNLKGFTYFKAL